MKVLCFIVPNDVTQREIEELLKDLFNTNMPPKPTVMHTIPSVRLVESMNIDQPQTIVQSASMTDKNLYKILSIIKNRCGVKLNNTFLNRFQQFVADGTFNATLLKPIVTSENAYTIAKEMGISKSVITNIRNVYHYIAK